MASSRGSTRRGANRLGETFNTDEEVGVWKDVQSVKLPEVINGVNDSSAIVRRIEKAGRKCAEAQRKRDSPDDLRAAQRELDNTVRESVKINEAASAKIKALIAQVEALQAVAAANDHEKSTGNSRSASHHVKDPRGAAANSDLYDFDGRDSPVPSPNPVAPRRLGGGSKGERSDSVPPKLQDRSTPATKADSAEPQAGPSSTAATSAMRAKQIFSRQDEVAFRPKTDAGDQQDWILGNVVEVRGDGKRRTYRVRDADETEENHPPQEYTMKASGMILIPKSDDGLPALDKGTLVLALYPATTTFYKAEVNGMKDPKTVALAFDGEEQVNTIYDVSRRHVLGYRE